mmetsp:Transcript_61682/g.127419  ORF Transcript_61682/g.127419 Transcript_61682/m.127419 type:complete len:378 (+) Transcript_61682:419-1552(+)
MNILPPPPPPNYEYRTRPFRGKAPVFDGRNFEFYREELSMWMKNNFQIDWILITDDIERNTSSRKPTDPQTEFCDQEHAWNAILTGCKHIQDLQSILELTIRGTKHMQFASFAWKDIVECYDPNTPAAKRQKILQFKAAVANFDGDVFRYKTTIRALLADPKLSTMPYKVIKLRILRCIWNSPVGGDLHDNTSWRSFVKESAASDHTLDSIFNRAERHSGFQQQVDIWFEDRPTSTSNEATPSNTATPSHSAAPSNNTTAKGKRDREDKESSNDDKDEEHCKERCKERGKERGKEHSEESSKADDKTTSPSVKSKRQRRRPQKHVRLQQKAAAEQAQAQGSSVPHASHAAASLVNLQQASLPDCNATQSPPRADSPY